MTKIRFYLLFSALFLVSVLYVGFSSFEHTNQDVVNVYTARKEEFVRDMFTSFTRATGIKVNVIHDNPGKLLARMRAEKNSPQSDIFIAANAINLFSAKEGDLIERLSDDIFANQDYSHLSDKDHYWVALTKRARVIVYAKDRVDGDLLKSYWDLADARWKGRLLVSSSMSSYNQALVAYMIYHNGFDKALMWGKGLVENMARKPYGGDTDQIRAIVAGEGDIALSNSYYVARFLSNNPDANKKIGVVFPEQDNVGTHVNISGAGVTKGAVRRENAIKLIRFMLTSEAQGMYSQFNNEYPVLSAVKLADVVDSLGSFKEDKTNIWEWSDYVKDAVRLSDQASWR